jgi:hypothetical protein
MAKTVQGAIFDKMVKNLGVGTVLNAAFTVKDYKDAREQGYGVPGAAAKALGSNIMMSVIGPGKYIAMQMGMEIPALAVKGYEAMAQQARSMASMGTNKPFQNATFVDTQQNYTMRQAGMQLAKSSQYNMQQAMMGNEASFMHI